MLCPAQQPNTQYQRETETGRFIFISSSSINYASVIFPVYFYFFVPHFLNLSIFSIFSISKYTFSGTNLVGVQGVIIEGFKIVLPNILVVVTHLLLS